MLLVTYNTEPIPSKVMSNLKTKQNTTAFWNRTLIQKESKQIPWANHITHLSLQTGMHTLGWRGSRSSRVNKHFCWVLGSFRHSEAGLLSVVSLPGAHGLGMTGHAGSHWEGDDANCSKAQGPRRLVVFGWKHLFSLSGDEGSYSNH